MRILVTGKDGQLGKSIQNLVTRAEHSDDFVFVGRKELDLSSKGSIDRYFEVDDRFDVVINCAAYTAVDKAEEEWELADQINHLAVGQMARIASRKKIKFVHISTDYVFDGESGEPYVEGDKVNPINVYGKTKLAGEFAVQEAMPDSAIIIRTSWVYSGYGSNFVKTILRLSGQNKELNIVRDQIGSPTYAPDLAAAILHIVLNEKSLTQDRPTEVYHYANLGRASWFEFAQEVFELLNIRCDVKAILTSQYPTLAKRPKNTVMNINKIVQEFGVEVVDWRDRLNIIKELLKESV